MTVHNPLASAAIRQELRSTPVAGVPSAPEHRPLALRFATNVPTPVARDYTYDRELQMATDPDGRPLIEMAKKGKEWKTKAQSDGDEGPEEDWGWEEN